MHTQFAQPHILPERNRERSILETYASRTVPELVESERRLQCYIEGIEKDNILVRFTHIDKTNLDREFSVVIDVSNNVYKGEPLIVIFLLPILTCYSAYHVPCSSYASDSLGRVERNSRCLRFYKASEASVCAPRSSRPLIFTGHHV